MPLQIHLIAGSEGLRSRVWYPRRYRTQWTVHSHTEGHCQSRVLWEFCALRTSLWAERWLWQCYSGQMEDVRQGSSLIRSHCILRLWVPSKVKMSMAHICNGWDGVGVGVRGAAAFWAWNQVQVSHCQTASSMALFMPSQKTHPWANNCALMVPWWNWWSCCSTYSLSDGGMMRASPCRTRPSSMARVSQCCQYGHNRQGTA